MTAHDLKRDIHQLVDSVQNEMTLVDLHNAVALIIEQQDMPLDNDDPALRERLSRLNSQIERGDYITNEAIKQEVKQWLAK